MKKKKKKKKKRKKKYVRVKKWRSANKQIDEDELEEIIPTVPFDQMQVRLIALDGINAGLMTLEKAHQIASSQEMAIINVSNDPPVYRVVTPDVVEQFRTENSNEPGKEKKNQKS